MSRAAARIVGYLRRHRGRLRSLAEAITLNLAWTWLKRLGVFGAGIASAAAVSTLTGTTSRVATIDAPRRYALPTLKQRELVAAARRYGPGSGTVYVWGGSSPLGFDCSGYVYFVHRKAGIVIPRGSRAQWSYGGRAVAKGHERPGDVVYFVGSLTGANAGPPPGHEGMYVGGGRFIEYYSGGRPAHEIPLAWTNDYMGAKRWYTPAQIPRRHASTIVWFAHHFHVKIQGSHRYTVTFKPWRGHGRFGVRTRHRMVRWAHHHHHRTSGDRRYLNVTF